MKMSKNSTCSNTQPDPLFIKFSNNISCWFVNLSNNSDKSVASRTISDFSEGNGVTQYSISPVLRFFFLEHT